MTNSTSSLLVATLGSTVLVAEQSFCLAVSGARTTGRGVVRNDRLPSYSAATSEAGIKYLGAGRGFRRLPPVRNGTYLWRSACTQFGGGSVVRLARADFDRWLVLPGLALIVTGFGFKLAVVPFHLWTPDVYQGAPAPVTAYIATVSKGAMFALLLRFFYSSGAHALAPVFIVFSIIAIASMVVGNLLALLQNNVKRILDDALNGRRYCAIRFRQLRRIVFQDRAHGVGGGLPSKRPFAGEHLVENRAEAENVTAVGGFLPPHLFRRHVAHGAEHYARTGGTTGRGERLLDRRCHAR